MSRRRIPLDDWIGVKYVRSKYEAPLNRPCAVCGCGSISWDHCHEHGYIRGPVCGSCNGFMAIYDAGESFNPYSRLFDPDEYLRQRTDAQSRIVFGKVTPAAKDIMTRRAMAIWLDQFQKSMRRILHAHASSCPECSVLGCKPDPLVREADIVVVRSRQKRCEPWKALMRTRVDDRPAKDRRLHYVVREDEDLLYARCGLKLCRSDIVKNVRPPYRICGSCKTRVRSRI